MDDITIRHVFKMMIAEAGAFMAVMWYFLLRGKPSLKTRFLFNAVLLVLALSACAAYFEFGWLRYGQYMNPHDVYHYHMGSKYSREHQYFDLYRATLVADRELGAKYGDQRIRNLNDHRYESVSAVLRDSARYKALFTPERWEEFKGDVSYWRTVMPQYKWNALLRDKGYNATPVWNAVARFLTERIPTSSEWGMRFLTYIDLVFLAVLFAALGFTFGWRVMLFAIIFHGSNYFMSFVHIKGAFMRLDWVAMLVLSACALKRGRHGLAGALAAYAGMTRIFPFIFLFPLGVKALLNGISFLRAKMSKADSAAALHRGYVTFFLVLGLTTAALGGGAALSDGGFQLWENFFDKIAVHNTDISTNRAGFKYIFVWGASDRAGYFEEHQFEWKLILGMVLLMTAYLARRAEDYESIPLGFLPAFFFVAPTFYYFVMLLVPLILFLPKARAWDRTLGVTLFFTFSCAAFSLGLFMPHHFQLFYYLSCGLLFLCAYMAFCVVSAPLAVAVHVTSGSVPEDTHALRGGASKAWGRKALGAVIVLALIAGGIFGARYYVGTLGTVAPPPPNATERAGEGEVELVFTGDVMLARNVERSLRSARRDFSFPFAECAAYTQGADLAFCNLESPISGRGEPIEKTYLFNAPPDALDGIYFAGFDVVSLANNHILDFGPVAMADTLRHLESRGIVPIGITMLDEAQAPFIRSVRGVRIAYLAYCDPVPKYSYAREFYVFDERPARATKENLARDITAAKESADIVVVSLHWGIEYQPEPNAHQRDLGRFIIDQGAHIVAGHHPHVQQEPETYKHGLIIHSMGNFVFDQHSRPPTRLSRLYRVYVNKEGIVRAEYLPLEIVQSIWQPKPTQGAFIAIQ